MGTDIPKQYLPLAEDGTDFIEHAVRKYTKLNLPLVLSTLHPYEDNEYYGVETVQAYKVKGMSILVALDHCHDFAVDQIILVEVMRPFTPLEQVKHVLGMLKKGYPVVVCGVQAYETIHVRGDSSIEGGCGYNLGGVGNRPRQMIGQTPEGFDMLLLRKLVLASMQEGDESSYSYAAMAMRPGYSGYEMAVVIGDPINFKVTFPHDLIAARALYEQGRR
jgi:2-C-methyl-D-erythritol 4-phosphate cytidylyltransferase